MDWKEKVQAILDDMVSEMGLPEGSLYLRTNYGKEGKITSYSVCIYEPEYPAPPKARSELTRNSTVLNVKEGTDRLELIMGKDQFAEIQAPVDAEIKQQKSDQANMHVLMALDSNDLLSYIQENTRYALANYTSKASSFACCSKFNECSDAKRCVHENLLYSKACVYRSNLDAGRIFYGQNRNVN